MNRRGFLGSVGTSSLAALAGCTGLISGSSESEGETVDEPRKPIPGDSRVLRVTDVSESDAKMEVRMLGNGIHRTVTFNLYRNSPSDGDPGSWEKYDLGGGKSRPYLAYKSEGTKVSATATDVFQKPRHPSNVVYAVLGFPADEEPAGVPLDYTVELEESNLQMNSHHTEYERTRRVLGRTQMMVKRPGTGKFVLPDADKDDTFSMYGHDPFYLVHREGNTYGGAVAGGRGADGAQSNWVVSSSNDSPWLEPEMDLYERSDSKYGAGRESGQSVYRRGAFERPWGAEVRIPYDAYARWTTWNERRYVGAPSTPRDIANVTRLVTREDSQGNTALDNDVLAQVATDLNATAEGAGLTSPEQKLQFIADFTQYMRYTGDDSLPAYKPRVKHPITTLYEMRGDCEDKVVLAMALLYQDAFPDYKLSTYYVRRTPTGGAHVGLAVHKDAFEANVMEGSSGEHDDYLYVEVTFPKRLGKTGYGFNTPRVTNCVPAGHPVPDRAGGSVRRWR